MKIRFTQGHTPKGDAVGIPVYVMGEAYEFKGPVAETYARKYIARGYAVDVTNERAPKPAKAAAEPPKLEEPKADDPPKETVKSEPAKSGFMGRLGGGA